MEWSIALSNSVEVGGATVAAARTCMTNAFSSCGPKCMSVNNDLGSGRSQGLELWADSELGLAERAVPDPGLVERDSDF